MVMTAMVACPIRIRLFKTAFVNLGSIWFYPEIKGAVLVVDLRFGEMGLWFRITCNF